MTSYVMATENKGCSVFDNLTGIFTCISNGRTENQRRQINSILNELNNLNFKCPVVTNANRAVLLIHKCCTLVPTDDVELIEKCCTLIVNLISLQRVVLEGVSLIVAIEWAINSLKSLDVPNTSVLKCLESLIRDNVQNIQEQLVNLIGNGGVLIVLIQPIYSLEIQLWAVKCLEALTYSTDEQSKYLSENYFNICLKVFVELVMREKLKNFNEFLYSKLLTSCLRGIYNVIIQNPKLAHNDLGVYLGISRCYMNYGLYGTEWVKPQRVMPSNMSISDTKPAISRDKKGGKITKQRKQRKSGANKNDERKEKDTENTKDNERNKYYHIPVINTDNLMLPVSDSDFSDSEQSQSNKIPITQGKVRQAALNILLSLIKVIDKHTMFGYWSSFLPDGSPTCTYNLNNCILKDPSPRGRIAALNVVLSMVNGSRLYLSQAESSTKIFAFTPFSMILGTMIQELHNCLCSALNDNVLPVLTQVLKCLALLVQATPYHRLSPGLMTKIIKSVRPFIRHRDASIQVAAFTVLSCALTSEPTILETLDCFLTQNWKKNQNVVKETSVPNVVYNQDTEDIDYSSDEEIDDEPSLQMSWLLHKCLRNLGVMFETGNKNVNVVPAPVKLESVQVISAMCRNYFEALLAPHIICVAKAMKLSLNDKYTDLRLHAGRTIDSVGSAMEIYLSSDEPKRSNIDKELSFWQTILSDSLSELIQSEQASLRAVGCDCLSSVGSQVYEHLPREKQILIVTLLFSCSRDEENSVRGAAVRALAISVLYPSLCEDAGFIADTSESIIRNLSDSNLILKIKTSWSLGNLSDALVLNINSDIQDELPENLITNLLSSSILLANDNDKIKSNCARALGNLLRLVTAAMLEREHCKEIVGKAIEVLVKLSNTCNNMKVRWNSCYAIGNVLKNTVLYTETLSWQESVFSVLRNLVVNCKNFKVRINSALALSVPQTRKLYGNFYILVWKSLLEALENSQNIEDFTEYKHRDNLVDQICLTLSHLTIIIIADDLTYLSELLALHYDFIRLQMHRVQERLVPEKSELLLKASNNFKTFPTDKLSSTGSNVVEMLIQIFKFESF